MESCYRYFQSRTGRRSEQSHLVGDNPNLPRDPDEFESEVGFENQREFRERGVPSGLAHEIFLDVYERPVSFMPGEKNLQRRLFEAYEEEVERVDPKGHGIITANGDIDTATDGFPNNERLYLHLPCSTVLR